MAIQGLVVAYQTKTDEELLQLVGSPEQLTPEACAALKGELAKRRIDSAAHLNAEEENGQTNPSEPRTSGTQILRESQSVGEFVGEVLSFYHDHFWLFVKLIAPAVIVGYVAVVMGRNEGQEIARHLPHGLELLGHQTEIPEIWFANFIGYFVSWMAFCFSFGAICSAVGQIAAGAAPPASDCFAEVRGRVGSFLRLSTLLFSLALVAVAGTGLLDGAVFWIFHQRHAHPSFFIIRVVSFLFASLALLVLSRFGLALPALILDNCRVSQAMFRSDELNRGKVAHSCNSSGEVTGWGLRCWDVPLLAGGLDLGLCSIAFAVSYRRVDCGSDSSRAVHVHRLGPTLHKNDGGIVRPNDVNI